MTRIPHYPQIICLLLLIMVVFPLKAEPEKTDMPSVLMADSVKLILNGSGTRKKFWINLFDGGLYLKEKCSDGNKIMFADEPMAIRLKVTSELVTGKRLEENIRLEFARVTKNKVEPYQERINALVKVLSEQIVIGDVFDLIYLPGQGLKIYKNNSFRTTIKGLDFKQTVFDTWFGQDPADVKFKEGMLGVSS